MMLELSLASGFEVYVDCFREHVKQGHVLDIETKPLTIFDKNFYKYNQP